MPSPLVLTILLLTHQGLRYVLWPCLSWSDRPMVSVGIDFCFSVLFDVTRRPRLVFVHDTSSFFSHYLRSLCKLKPSVIVKTGNYSLLP